MDSFQNNKKDEQYVRHLLAQFLSEQGISISQAVSILGSETSDDGDSHNTQIKSLEAQIDQLNRKNYRLQTGMYNAEGDRKICEAKLARIHMALGEIRDQLGSDDNKKVNIEGLRMLLRQLFASEFQ